MLKDEDRIFKNIYNDFGYDIESSIKRGDWLHTKDIISKGKDFIIKESLKKARYCNPYTTINITSISRTLPQLIQKILRPLEDWWSLGESNP